MSRRLFKTYFIIEIGFFVYQGKAIFITAEEIRLNSLFHAGFLRRCRLLSSGGKKWHDTCDTTVYKAEIKKCGASRNQLRLPPPLKRMFRR